MAHNRDITVIQAQTDTESRQESVSTQWFERRATERRDITKYLHDTLAQDLVVLSFALEKLRYTPHFRPSAELDHAIDMAEKCCQDLRTLNVSLSTPAVEEPSLPAAIQWYAQRLRVEGGLNIELVGAESAKRGRREVRDLFLEAMREWAGKAILEGRHGQITRVNLAEKDAYVRLELLSDRSDDPGILAVAGSPFLARRASELGGRLEAGPAGSWVSLTVEAAA